MAMLHLAAHWNARQADRRRQEIPSNLPVRPAPSRSGPSPHTPPLQVATVDHGLRPAAAEEARKVAALCAALGLPHHILRLEPDGRRRGLQAWAREGRYALLRARARETGCDTILTAHTRDDQAETVLMRLCAGSGPLGLAAMRPDSQLGDGLRLARPLLAIPKARLLATCDAAGIVYARDPSNVDDRFARARWRRVMAMLAREGLTPTRLVRLAERAARLADTIEMEARALLAATREPADANLARIALTGWQGRGDAIVVRALQLAVADIGAGEPPLARTEALAEALLVAVREGKRLRRTLGGAVLTLARNTMLTIEREGLRRRGLSQALPVTNAKGVLLP